MGILNALRLNQGAPRPDYLASPFAEGQLNTIAWNDIFQGGAVVVSRAEAMAVPAVSKARALITTTVARLPLRVLDKNGMVPDDKQPTWTYRTDGAISPFLRMVWTLDDLLFYGASLWSVVRGSDGFPISAERVPYDWWKVNADGAILIHDELVNANDVIYIPAPIEGLLDRGAGAVREARSIASSVANKVANPLPLVDLHATDADTQPNEAEAKELVRGYNQARRDPEGTTVFTPASIDLKVHGDKVDLGFMTEGRNAVRLDIANLTNIPAALLDGSVSEASLTYSTQEGRRNEFIDYGLAQWLAAVETRLSQDDVVPRGQRVRFDLTDFLALAPNPTGAPQND